MLSNSPKFSSIVIYTNNIERLRQFYELLDIQFFKEKHGNGPEHYSAQIGQLLLEIYPSQTELPSGTVRVGLKVQNLDSLVAKLQEAGVQFRTMPIDSPWGRRAVAIDPTGNSVELTEH